MQKYWKQFQRGKRCRNSRKSGGILSWINMQISGMLPEDSQELRCFWEGFSGKDFLSS